jgi:hypothetical protein
MEQINIIELTEKNSITRLSREYENKLINKVKETFSNTEQQIFLSSFYCFLNYDSKKDFVVDFDNVWKWLGFSRKSDGKRVLDKHFTIDIDYIILRQPPQNSKEGGRPCEKINLTVNAFKKYCLKAGTKKADEIHDYYIKLENLLQETINEETNELRIQLQNKEKDLLLKDEKLKEETIIRKQLKAKYECFLSRRIDIDNKFDKGHCIYLIGFSEMSNKFKIGYTSDLKKRISDFHTEMPFEPVIYYHKYVLNLDPKIIEQTIHYTLKKFRIHNSKEWFQTDNKQIFINEIDDVILFYENKDSQYENIIDVKGDIEDILSTEDIDTETVMYGNEDVNDIVIKEDTKKCSKCAVDKPKDKFAKNPTRSDGLDNNCKACHKESYNKSKEQNKITIEEKKCTKCDTVKNITEFYNRIGSIDGKTSECNDCTKIMYKNRFETRKDKSIDTKLIEKICKDCNVLLDISNFSKKTDSKDGYNFNCKSCISKKIKQKSQVVKEVPESKCCNMCNKDLPITRFWNCKSNNDGKNNRCSDCCKGKRNKL